MESQELTDLFSPLAMSHGPDWSNRFMLSPLTNQQSHADGTLGDDEYRWLTMRAEGGFGLTMTCASHVQQQGIGFEGQLGVWSDAHLDGLTRLANGLNSQNTHSVVQLHHAGMRTPHELIDGAPVCPSDNEKFGARGLNLDEVEQLKADFVAAAKRAEQAGFHGVELHGAHGYILCQFLSSEINHREDAYGGSLENRSRILFDLVSQIRAECGPDFSLGVRLSPERFGMRLAEVQTIAQKLMRDALIDYLDMSLWDIFKEPVEEAFQGQSLLSYFTSLERGTVKLGAAGKIRTAAEAQRALDEGLDYVAIGRSAILHHDFPEQVRQDSAFEPATLPVTPAYLNNEGLSDTFVKYMGNWKGFVAEETPA